MTPNSDDIFQVLTPEGELVGDAPDLPGDRLVDLYYWMVFGRLFSDRMVALQRQGRMGTFAPSNGQEAVEVGMIAPLESQDWFLGTYRDNLANMVKGLPLLATMKQWGGDLIDNLTYETRCLPCQVVLGVHTLHAVGLAMAAQYKNEPSVVVASCGDGATSLGDFSEALNLAGVFKAPVVLVVQNNGWAISTPRQQQTAAAYIAHRGPGFGVPARLVDGNDLLAVYQVTAEAVARARASDGPTLIEAITYRMGAHTTADDPTKYRPEAERKEWLKRDPLTRLRKFLLTRNLLTRAEDKRLHEQAEAEMQAGVEAYEALPPPDPAHLFALTYAAPPPQLQQQQADLLQALKRVQEASYA